VTRPGELRPARGLTPVAAGALAGLLAVVVLALGATLVVRQYPFVHMESATYLANALDGRAPLVQILDVQRNDFGLYQARELSYATDWIDARAAAAWFAATGRFLPISLVHLIACGVIVGLSVGWLRSRAPALGSAALVPALLFATSASTVLGTRHFRTAKSLAALALTALLWQLARWLEGAHDRSGRSASPDATRPGPWAAFAIGMTALVLVLADRQGSFFVPLLGAFVWIAAGRSLALQALVLAFAAGATYDLWVGPWLIERVVHQQVNWSLQSGTVDPAELAAPDVWRGASIWLLESVGLLIGGFGVMWGAVVLCAGVAAARFTGGRRWMVRAIAAVGALALFAILLKSRHPPIDAPDVRVAYYNTPLLALMTVGLGLALQRLSAHPAWPRWRRGVVAAACLGAAANLVAVPRLARRVAAGADAGYIPVTAALTQCIERESATNPLDQVPRDVAWLGRYRRLCDRYRALR
jgi:hypothetical protein